MMELEDLPVADLIKILNEEDERVLKAVRSQSEVIESAIDLYVRTLKAGGKVVYFGAGTSGRIAFMDAVELYPTFGVGRESVIPLIAGGLDALRTAVEGAEDSISNADQDFLSVYPSPDYLFMGLSATGRTPYVVEILNKAKGIGAKTVAITSTKGSPVTQIADLCIVLDVGEEIIKGSTRLKAGTAEKMVLNSISTISMIKLGKTEKGLMKNMVPLNSKLRERAISIVSDLAKCSREEAESALLTNDWKIQKAIDFVRGRDAGQS